MITIKNITLVCYMFFVSTENIQKPLSKFINQLLKKSLQGSKSSQFYFCNGKAFLSWENTASLFGVWICGAYDLPKMLGKTLHFEATGMLDPMQLYLKTVQPNCRGKEWKTLTSLLCPQVVKHIPEDIVLHLQICLADTKHHTWSSSVSEPFPHKLRLKTWIIHCHKKSQNPLRATMPSLQAFSSLGPLSKWE